MTILTNCFLIVIFSICGLSTVCVEGHPHNHESSSSRYRIDPFKKLLVAMNITKGDSMASTHLQHLLDTVISKYVCETKTACSNALCLSANDLIRIANGGLKSKLSRGEFYNFALVLFYRLQKKEELCKTPPDLNFSEYERLTVDLLVDGQRMISPIKLDQVLHRLTGTTHHDDNNHDDHHDDDHDDHHGHDHDRRRRSLKNVPNKTSSKLPRGSGVSAINAGSHEHDDHENELELPALYKPGCYNAELVIDQSHISMENLTWEVKTVASIIVYHLYKGTNFDDACRTLPVRTAFLYSIFEHFHAVNGSLTLAGFKEIIEKLGIGMSSEEHETDDHGHNHHKRSLNERVKRAAEPATMHTGMIDRCFTEMELLSVFSNEPKTTIGSEVFKDLCPALVQQYLSGVCKVKHKMTAKISRSESYGYGTLCVLLICLCSVVGAFVVVCKNQKAFSYTMALFEGLAVGTLTSDALLHLIPEALGLHKHEDDDHGAEESGSGIGFIWFSLACLGGLYLFYLLELVLSSFSSGHGHSHDFTASQNQNTEVYSVSENSKPIEEKVNSQMNIADVKTDMKTSYKIPPLAFMVVIGDALHNFADGLAIGAAFNQSVVIGFATSLAVLCHELPHELGDFGVLLSCGIGMKRAVIFNLFSSLTALIGLYIGLEIATDTIVRQWIFAVTSGMFLYIALVDLLPLLKATELKNNKGMLLFCNIGILCGVLLMLILGIYEEDIKF